jgi:sialic acid synthase SpsE
VDLPLIQRAAETGKPLIISTGMATLTEISEAVDCARQSGCKNLMILKCTTTYPADPATCNLKTIAHMRSLFGCEVGLSDHTIGIGVAIASVAFGASLIEKHFTLSREDGGIDSTFSSEPDEFKTLVKETEAAWKGLGDISYGPSLEEIASRSRRRSIFFVEDLKKGEIIRAQHIRRLRPANGLPPKFVNMVIGRQVTESVSRGTPVSWDLLS